MSAKLRKFSFLLILLSLSAFFVSCGSKKEKIQPPPVGVTIMKVERQTVPAYFDYVGFAQSSHLVEIRARIEGYLDKIAFTEGGTVKEGDLLFIIDPRQYEAALEAAQGEQKRAEALLWEAQRAVKRYVPLYEKKAASQRDLDDALASQMAREADVISMKAKVKEAEVNLSYTTILSPVNGEVNKSTFREGALVSPGPNNLLTQVSVLDPIWVYFNISEFDLLKASEEIKKDLLKYPNGMNFDVQLILADGSTYPHTGKVDFASPTLDQKTGTMNVRAVFPNPEKTLKPGQFVSARVMGADHPNVMIVPQTSVLQGRTGMFVFVVDKDDKVATRFIEPGQWYGQNWIINGGLQNGDQVVVEGINKIQNGAIVKITKEYTQDDINKKSFDKKTQPQ